MKFSNIDTIRYKLLTINLNEMLDGRELGHRITVPDALSQEGSTWNEEKQEHGRRSSEGSCSSGLSIRVSTYRGHPVIRRDIRRSEPGRLIRLPKSLMELKILAGEKFGFDATNALLINEEGAEIDSIEVIS